MKNIFSKLNVSGKHQTLLFDESEEDNYSSAFYEYTPPVNQSEDTTRNITSLFHTKFPEGTILKFSVVSQEVVIQDVNRKFMPKIQDNQVLNSFVKSMQDLYSNRDKWEQKTKGSLLRDIDYIATIHIPKKHCLLPETNSLQEDFKTYVSGMSENGNIRNLLTFDLEWKLLGNNQNQSNNRFKQVMDDEQPVKVNGQYISTVSVTAFPNEIDCYFRELLTGGIFNIRDDAKQLSTPYIMTFSIKFGKNKAIEYSLSATLMDKNEEKTKACTLKLVQMWESLGCLVSKVKPAIAFREVMPLCPCIGSEPINTESGNLSLKDICLLIPTTRMFTGLDNVKTAMFTNRKNEISTLGCFTGYPEKIKPINFFLCGNAGSGKSVASTYMLVSHLANKGCAVVIDYGGAFKDLVNKIGGKYIEVYSDKQECVCLNPFTFASPSDLPFIAKVLLNLVLNSMPDVTVHCHEELEKYFGNAAVITWAEKGNLAGFEDFKVSLEKTFNQFGVTQKHSYIIESLKPFCLDGKFGGFLNGTCVDISEDNLVVFNFENNPRFFDVCMFLSTVNSKQTDYKMIVIDELWWLAKTRYEGNVLMGSIFNDFYKKAKEKNCAAMVMSQSLLDLKFLGVVEEVIQDNTNSYLLMESCDFDKARHEKLLESNSLEMQLMKSVKANRPRYSEIYVKSPYGNGIVRVVLSDYAFFLCCWYDGRGIDFASMSQEEVDAKLLEMVAAI